MERTVRACFLLANLLIAHFSWAQIGLNPTGAEPHPSAMLDVDAQDKGVLVPRLTQSQRDAIDSPATGLLIYQTDFTPGFYYYNGTTWTAVTGQTWGLSGNAGTLAGLNYLGTTDAQALDIRTEGTLRARFTTKGQIEILNTGESVFIGERAGANDDLTDNQNTFVGHQSGYSNNTGFFNTALGHNTLFSNTTGLANVALGNSALFLNSTQSNLVAVGDQALFNNGQGASDLEGSSNTAVGSKALFSNTLGYQNTGQGFEVLFSNTTGSGNTAQGAAALYGNTEGNLNTAMGFNTLTANTTGFDNTAVGAQALTNNFDGYGNSALGALALLLNSSGNYNTVVGSYALLTNMTGSQNTALGYQSLLSNSTGHSNTALGAYALFNNNEQSNLVAVGDSALYNNGQGAFSPFEAIQNTAVGSKALFGNTTGFQNTAVGSQALFANTSGLQNTAQGFEALYENTEGSFNTAQGATSLRANTSGSNNTAIGSLSLQLNTEGSQNTALGYGALQNSTLGGNNIAIGYLAGQNVTNASNSIHIGNEGVDTTGAVIKLGTLGIHTDGVFMPLRGAETALSVNYDLETGELTYLTSSQRYKHQIRDMGTFSDKLVDLRPVAYHYRPEFRKSKADPERYGLIAEEVAKVYPHLVVYNAQGEAETVAYQELIPLLLNQVNKLTRENQQLKADVQELGTLQAEIDAIKALLSQLVSTSSHSVVRLAK